MRTAPSIRTYRAPQLESLLRADDHSCGDAPPSAPPAPTEEYAGAAVDTFESAGPSSGPRRPIAVVCDDDGSWRALLRDLLEDLGLSVLEVAQPERLEAALDAAASPVDLVLTDGLSSSATLGVDDRARLAALGTRAPTILISGQRWALGATEDELGVACLLPKPLDVDELEKQIRRCLVQSGIALPHQ